MKIMLENPLRITLIGPGKVAHLAIRKWFYRNLFKKTNYERD